VGETETEVCISTEDWKHGCAATVFM
jgi:hypothetical protein